MDFVYCTFFVGGVGFWRYESEGVKTFGEKMRRIEGMSLKPAEQAEIELNFDGDEDGRYTGSLMRVSNEAVCFSPPHLTFANIINSPYAERPAGSHSPSLF